MGQYLISVFHAAGFQDSEFGSYADEAAMQAAFAAVGTFNDELERADALVFAGGLTDPTNAKVVDGTGGQPHVIDGPLAAADEYQGGFWIVQAPDLGAAQQLATDASAACGLRVELRPLQGR